MQAETKDAIAQAIAKHIIKSHAEDIEYMSINEMTYDEVEGLDSDLSEELVKRVANYVKVADVHVSFPYHMIDRQTGEVRSQEEIAAQFGPLEF